MRSSAMASGVGAAPQNRRRDRPEQPGQSEGNDDHAEQRRQPEDEPPEDCPNRDITILRRLRLAPMSVVASTCRWNM